MTEARDSRWSVALSGGGHRAALFSVGAMLALADGGWTRQVDSVVSVSGGSLANGVLAKECNVQQADGQALRTAFAALVGRCASTGTVQYARPIQLALGATGLGIAGFLSGLRARRGWRSLLGLGILAGAYQSLSRLAERVFDEQFFKGATLADLDRADRPVAHVFCATELQAREHLYFAPRFALSLPTRFVAKPRLKVATAVQASAAFPVFPPRLLSARRIGFTASDYPQLWLSDGGVYDNMGDEWARSYWSQVKRFPEMRGLAEPPERLLVVNATANGDARVVGALARVPVVGALLARIREIAIMNGGTTATRRLDLLAEFDRTRIAENQGQSTPPSTLEEAEAQSFSSRFIRPPITGSLVHIATDAGWPVDHPTPPPGADPANYRQLRADVAAFPERAALRCAGEHATHAQLTLGAMPRGDVVDVIWHGYMLTMTNLAVFEGGAYAPITRAQIASYVDGAAVALQSDQRRTPWDASTKEKADDD